MTNRLRQTWTTSFISGSGERARRNRNNYGGAAYEVKLNVKQTQKVEGMVDLFDMPVDIEIATASGHLIVVSKAEETFTLPADGAPSMVIFDKGDEVLKVGGIQEKRC